MNPGPRLGIPQTLSGKGTGVPTGVGCSCINFAVSDSESLTVIVTGQRLDSVSTSIIAQHKLH